MSSPSVNSRKTRGDVVVEVMLLMYEMGKLATAAAASRGFPLYTLMLSQMEYSVTLLQLVVAYQRAARLMTTMKSINGQQ